MTAELIFKTMTKKEAIIWVEWLDAYIKGTDIYLVSVDLSTIITRDQATKVIPLLKAFAEGKAIQKYINGKWKYIDIISLTDLYASIKNYRIKDTSSTIVYKPFIDKTECIAEMQHHKQFGWIKRKDEQHYYSIVEIMDNHLLLVGTSKFSGRVCDFKFNFKEAFNHFRFLDGTPFGVKCKQNDI